MLVDVAGIGVWGPGFSSYRQYREFVASDAAEPGEALAPKPELIPPRERRRSPLMVKLAIEVADQACEVAAIDRSALRCVFSSGIGDSELTDYMCRVLAGPEKLLSPTKFHNSVHNAAVGYWSISTGCEQAATFVSSLDTSFSTALMEAMVQVVSSQQPVLLVLSDVPTPVPMWNMHPIDHMFALALVLCPAGTHRAPLLELGFNLQSASDNGENQKQADARPDRWPALSAHALQALYQASPSARSLCFLNAIDTAQSSGAKQTLQLPLSDGLTAETSVNLSRSFDSRMQPQ